MLLGLWVIRMLLLFEMVFWKFVWKVVKIVRFWVFVMILEGIVRSILGFFVLVEFVCLLLVVEVLLFVVVGVGVGVGVEEGCCVVLI